MTKEQEAIETCKKKIIEPFYVFPNPTSIKLKDTDVEAVETVLSMLKEKDEEIEKLKADNKKAWKLNANMTQRHLSDIFKIKKKDKIINLMAEYIDEDDTSLANFLYRKNGKCNKEMIKQYFKEIAERKSEE